MFSFNLDIIHQYMSIYFLFLAMCWRELGGMDWQIQATHFVALS